MKKLIYVMAVFATAFVFQGCGNSSGSATDMSDTTKMATGSMSSDTMAMSMEQMDIDFAKKVAVGGMAEVAFGKMAQEKGMSTKVKDFGKMMVTDHSKANEELMEIAKKQNIALPAGLDEDHMKKMEELKSKTGADFDKAYVDAMVGGHQKMLALLQDGAQNCKDSALKDFAAKTAPVVKSHLDMITKIQAGLK
ncbi:putative membrane protein [Pedobacter sp. UYP24]